jgi:hypothetical protein
VQVAMHSPGDCVPCGSSTHWPALQLYMTGVGAGVGTSLQVAMHSPGDSEPC